MSRRVVITGIGLVCPLGSTPAELSSALEAGQSGVTTCDNSASGDQPMKFAGQSRQFTGAIDNFGPLEGDRKKAIRKGLKVMCRETQMAVAAAQMAMTDAGFPESTPDPERSGVVLGSDYMMTMPEDYTSAIAKCTGDRQELDFARWGKDGLDDMAPLWMLKYLPNMPASHIAIFHDLRGPNNSLTMREAASLLAVGEAFRTIQRGHADRMIAGATGTRIMPMQALHALQTEQMASQEQEPARASRPFDRHRTGMVAGEGAGMLVLEEFDAAQCRGARIYGEIIGLGSSQVADPNLVGRCDQALAVAMRAALRDAGRKPEDVGHLNAHGLGTIDRDRDEARAIAEVFGPSAATLPVIALKSYFGNLGAGSGIVELVGSLLALSGDSLPRVLNFETPDPECSIAVVRESGTSPGRSFLSVNVTPQGQAAAVYVEAV
jgi:3-oxoacyl-[acyl-carrier-protein] synthase II